MDELVVESVNSKDDVALKSRLMTWTDDQIVKLNEAVALFGNNWELVS
jgi:hypothetical protein